MYVLKFENATVEQQVPETNTENTFTRHCDAQLKVYLPAVGYKNPT